MDPKGSRLALQDSCTTISSLNSTPKTLMLVALFFFILWPMNFWVLIHSFHAKCSHTINSISSNCHLQTSGWASGWLEQSRKFKFAYVLRSICPSIPAGRRAARRGCRCSGRIGRPWAYIFWSSSLRSSSRCRWSGKNIWAQSALPSARPVPSRFLQPAGSGWQISLSVNPGCSSLKDET